MRSARLGANLDERAPAAASQNRVAREGVAPAVQNRHLLAVARVSAYGGVYRCPRRARRSGDQRQIDLLRRPRPQLLAQRGVGGVRLGDHQQPRRILVKAVDDSGAERVRARLRQALVHAQQGVDQR